MNNTHLIKGGIATFELILFSFIGIVFNRIYIRHINNEDDKKSYKYISKALLYIFTLMSFCFFIRSLTKNYFQRYTKNIWPEPIMFGFGMLLFQKEILRLAMSDIYI